MIVNSDVDVRLKPVINAIKQQPIENQKKNKYHI